MHREEGGAAGRKVSSLLPSLQNPSKCSARVSLAHPHNIRQACLNPELPMRTEAQSLRPWPFFWVMSLGFEPDLVSKLQSLLW